MEMRESIETADPPQTGYLAELNRAFSIIQWEAGGRAVYSADENAAGGRPFLDSVEIQMGRPLRDQSVDLDAGKADIVEVDPTEPRRPGRTVWSSSPVRLLVLVFAPRIEDPRVREALALAVDRAAIHRVLLQRQGEISGALLPQWLSGYALSLSGGDRCGDAPARCWPAFRRRLALLTLGCRPANRRIADRIALNARDAGLTVSTGARQPPMCGWSRCGLRRPTPRGAGGRGRGLGLPRAAAHRFAGSAVRRRTRAARRLPRGSAVPPAGCLRRQPAGEGRPGHHAARASGDLKTCGWRPARP